MHMCIVRALNYKLNFTQTEMCVCVCVCEWSQICKIVSNKPSNNQQLTFSGPERTAQILRAKLQSIHITQL